MHRAIAASILLATNVLAMAPAKEAAKDMEDLDILTSLRKGHPRLMLTDERLAALKSQAETDKVLAGYVKAVIDRASSYCGNDLTVRTRGGKRQLTGGRQITPRAYALGLAWRWTGKEQYAEQLRKDLLAASGADDWRPEHFLSTGESAHGMGIGYDWIYDYLDSAGRREIAAAIADKAIRPGLVKHRRGVWWTKADDNWNHRTNGGLAIAALAIADEYPSEAAEMLNWIRRRLPLGIATYDRDGAWPEGPMYWRSTTNATVSVLDALSTALGTDWGMSDSEGLSKTAAYPVYTTGPTGLVFNFSDSHSGRGGSGAPFVYWLAKRYNRPDFLSFIRDGADARGVSAQQVLWYWKPAKPVPFRGKLDRLLSGSVDIAAFRSSWQEENALFVCMKGGNNKDSHGNLDLGTFVMDALGVRWATDLGGDSYSLNGYFAMFADNSKRWKYYRPSSHSHNVVTLGGKNQLLKAKARIGRFKGGVDEPYGVIDLSPAYAKLADRAIRGVKLIGDRRAVLVQDEFDLKDTCDVAWGMTTPAKIETHGPKAVLTQQGRRLFAEVLAPEGASFSAESAEQEPPQATNKGISRLMIRLPNRSGACRVAVQLGPALPDGASKVKPLRNW